MPLPRNQPSPQRQTVLTFATPKVGDLLFYETVDRQRVSTEVPDYGTPHPDAHKWPNHKLVFIESVDPNFYRYYYAADRSSQDDYNYELQVGQELTRTYVLPRTSYPADLAVPAGGAADTTFTAYGFVADSILDLGEPLKGWYIAVQRKYRPINTYDYPYSGAIEGNVKVTRTLKPASYELADDTLTSTPGTVYEVEYGNEYHNVLVKREESERAATSNTYNYKLVDGEYVERYYIIDRTDYPTSYPVPDGGTADGTYTAYGFVSDTLTPIESELQGGLVRLTRRYEPITKTEYPYDAELEQNITVSRILKPYGTTLASLGLVSGNGVIYEIKNVNQFHDILLTTNTGLTTPPTGTFSVDAGTDVFTSTAHGLQDGDALMFTSTGTLPSPLTTTGVWFVRDAAANTFKIATTVGGSAVDITSAGTGTRTFVVIATALPSVYTAVDSYPFPPKLTSYAIEYASAVVLETVYPVGETPRSVYREDMLPTYSLDEPKRGPFKVALRRWVTTTPDNASLLLDGVIGNYTKFPETKRETVVVGYAAYRAISFTADASLREFAVPESYHTSITINNTPPTLPTGMDNEARTLEPSSLAATTGFTGDFTGEYLIGLDTKETTGDLKEITANVMVLDANGIYP